MLIGNLIDSDTATDNDVEEAVKELFAKNLKVNCSPTVVMRIGKRAIIGKKRLVLVKLNSLKEKLSL